jgi:hypothetical protein
MPANGGNTFVMEKKQRKDKYETKLVVNGSFLDVIKASVSNPKPQETKPAPKKG